MEAIEEEPKKGLRDFLKIAFSSMSHLCSRLLAEGRPGYRPFSGVGWNQQSYWHTPRYMESNVWKKFDSAINGPQGLLKAKAESNEFFRNIKMASSFEQVLSGKADIYIYTGPSKCVMQRSGPAYFQGLSFRRYTTRSWQDPLPNRSFSPLALPRGISI